MHRINPLVLMSDLLFVLVMVFGLSTQQPSQKQHRAGATGQVSVPVATKRKGPKHDSQISGNGSQNLTVHLNRQGQLVAESGKILSVSALPHYLAQVKRPGILLIPDPTMDYRHVFQVMQQVYQQGVPVNLAEDNGMGGNPK